MNVVAWLKVKGNKRHTWWAAGAMSVSKTKPATSENEIAIKLDIEIPDAVFEEPVFEAKLVLPKVTRKLPDFTEISSEVEAALSKKMGFKIKLQMPENEETKNDL